MTSDGTQTHIAQTILDRGGDCILALKQNRPATFTEVEALFAAPPPSLLRSPRSFVGTCCAPSAAIGMHQTIDGEHGRVERRRSPGIETRTHSVCHDVDWLFSDRRYPGEPAFPVLAVVGMIESRTERDGKVEQERRYYLGSTRLDAETFARVVRSH